MRRGIKEAANESILTPRFYTTDFEEMEEMFSLERNPGIAQERSASQLRRHDKGQSGQFEQI